MKLIFFLLIGLTKISKQQYLTPPGKTIPEHFPYHAYIKADLYCLGALLSPKFVLLNAICVECRTTATVYLGARKDPTQILSGDQDFQKIKSAEIIIHPQFSKTTDKLLINNIALIKLLENALIMSTVRPIRLPIKGDFPLLPGMLLNITGYKTSMFSSSTLRYQTVRVRNQQMCYVYYGRQVLSDDERCVEGIGEERLDWTGVFTRNGRLIGLGRVLEYEAECLVADPICSPRDVFMTIQFHLDWIYDNSDVPRYIHPPKRIMIRPPPPIFIQAQPPLPPPPVFMPPNVISTGMISPGMIPPDMISPGVVNVVTKETKDSDAKHPKKGAE